MHKSFNGTLTTEMIMTTVISCSSLFSFRSIFRFSPTEYKIKLISRVKKEGIKSDEIHKKRTEYSANLIRKKRFSSIFIGFYPAFFTWVNWKFCDEWKRNLAARIFNIDLRFAALVGSSYSYSFAPFISF